jgi:hypothetical protein
MPDRFVKELLSVPTISIRKWLFRAVPFFTLVPESRQPPLLAPPDWLFTSGTRGHIVTYDSAEKPLEKTVGTEPDPPEYGKNDAFSLLEGRPPCRPQGFSAESTYYI